MEAVAEALKTAKAEDAAGWFSHAGYKPQDQLL